ncbi:MAG: HD domain-containing protein [Deinococcaceae bacterium]
MSHQILSGVLAIVWIVLFYVFKLPPVGLVVTGLLFLPWVWKTPWSGIGVGSASMLLHTILLRIFSPTGSDPMGIFWGISIGIFTLGYVAWMRSRELKDITSQRKALRALELGTLRLDEAQDAQSVMEAGLDAIRVLDLAPHLAFMRFQGEGVAIVLGRGGFSAFEGKYIGQLTRNPRQTQVEQLIRHLGDHVPPARDWQLMALSLESAGHKNLGTVVLARDIKREFVASERSLAVSLIRLFGAHLGQVTQLRELERLHEAAHMTLGLALEYRDYETPGHTARVVQMSEIFGQHLGLSLQERASLRAGAYLHDIGKMVIADQILLKPDLLSYEERETMEKHTLIGHELLSKLGFVSGETLEVVKYHHERFDGGGYPDGLMGEEIPYLARIFSIIDLFDALIHERPYKTTLTPTEAIGEIEFQMGRQLDPHLAREFIDLWTDGKFKFDAQTSFSFSETL